MNYLARRLVHCLFLLVGVSLLSFLFVELAPGSFTDEMKLNPRISTETLVNLQRTYGMDQPLTLRYLHWLRSAARGEFGFSFAYNLPVSSLLWPRARNTLLLTGSAFFLAWGLALPLGILSARNAGGWFDRAVTLTTSLLLATPELLLALLLLLFALRTRYLPVGGMLSLASTEQGAWPQLASIAAHAVGPVIVLALGSLPLIVRHTRAAMIEALDSPCIRAARTHGLPPWRILLRHAFPVAANPLISLFGLSFASLLSASLVAEVVMSWPGLGPLLWEAILARDLYVVIGTVMFASVLLVCGILLGDVLLFAVDPRIRSEKLA